jgi:dienelactone hydrolase
VYTLHMYDGTQHGFHQRYDARYDETAAKLAWTLLSNFSTSTCGRSVG